MRKTTLLCIHQKHSERTRSLRCLAEKKKFPNMVWNWNDVEWINYKAWAVSIILCAGQHTETFVLYGMAARTHSYGMYSKGRSAFVLYAMYWCVNRIHVKRKLLCDSAFCRAIFRFSRVAAMRGRIKLSERSPSCIACTYANSIHAENQIEFEIFVWMKWPGFTVP